MLLKLLERLGRKRIVMDREENEPYLERYYLFLKDRKRFPFNIFLHKFLKSDPDDVHDHPWPYLTIVLKGGYWEHTPIFDKDDKMITEFQTWRGPGSIIKRSAGEYHWLELEEGTTATTLFFMGPQQREWGFLTKTRTGRDRWVKSEHYLTDWKPYHEKYVMSKANRKEK